MNNADKKPRGRPRSDRSHRAILQATLELLAEVGFDAMSIEAISARAGVGKTTIYRRYASKEELVADAIESIREEIVLPDTGNLHTDIDELIQNAAQIVLTPLGRQTVATIVSSAASNPQFARIYQTKYLEPRRQDFAIVLARAKARKEISPELDADLFFDLMSGIMLYASIFEPTSESWANYIRRALNLVLKNISE
jgi:AcrR family transcriptional regulator